jgi:hypothetical protein
MNTYNLSNSFIPVSFTPYRHKQYGTKIGNKINFLQVENPVSIYVCTRTGFFTNDNEPGRIKNATHNTFPKLTYLF